MNQPDPTNIITAEVTVLCGKLWTSRQLYNYMGFGDQLDMYPQVVFIDLIKKEFLYTTKSTNLFFSPVNEAGNCHTVIQFLPHSGLLVDNLFCYPLIRNHKTEIQP